MEDKIHPDIITPKPHAVSIVDNVATGAFLFQVLLSISRPLSDSRDGFSFLNTSTIQFPYWQRRYRNRKIASSQTQAEWRTRKLTLGK
jgi:hypothetical protein